MKLATKAYGLIEVDEKQKVFFSQGLFGFEEYNNYVLLDAEREPFFWLQSMDMEGIAFVLINPFLFRQDYEADIANEELIEVGITSPDKALIYVIVTIPSDGSSMTANIQGPLVINRDTRTGKQVVLSDQRWHTRHDILAELNKAGKQ
jgi:flagellar assembly factor FliW